MTTGHDLVMARGEGDLRGQQLALGHAAVCQRRVGRGGVEVVGLKRARVRFKSMGLG